LASIGFATLEIIPSLKGVTEAINKQVEGKSVSVTIEPKVDQRATEQAGQQAKATVEKHTKTVTVEPKVDQAKAETAGKQAGEAVAKGVSGSSTAVGQALNGILEGAGGEAGRMLGERIAQAIPTGMTGDAERIGEALRRSLPRVGQVAGAALGSGIAIGIADAIGKERLDAAGKAVMSGLTRAVGVANTGTDIGVAVANKVAGGLAVAGGTIGNAAAGILETIGGVSGALDTTKQLLGGDDSWAAPGLDALNGALSTVTPLLEGVSGAATLASAGATAISTAAGIATKAQILWNAALIANPIGLIVAAIAAVVAGLVLFFTKTELGQKIWSGFTEYLKIAWEGIKIAFGAAWDVISGIFTNMTAGASAVWDGIKSAFGNVVDFVKGIPGAIASAASGMWDGISNAFKAMIDKLKGWWNGFASALSFTSPDWLPGDPVTFSLPTFATGGKTSGSTNQIAGVVHGGEYVIKASSTTGIENAMPGLLDYLNNKGALPGFEKGGKVQLGNISQPGITTSEQQSMWDAVRGKFPSAILSSATRTVMTEGHADWHNAGRAIDISGPNMGSIAAWIASNYPDSLELIHSPFSRNIKNGKNVGDGTSFYGANTMAGHRDHVHWALGKSAAQAAGTEGTDMLSVLDPGSTAAPAPAMAGATTATTSSSSVSVPGSFSGLSSMGLSGLGVTTQVNADSPERTLQLGSAAGAAIEGQVASALDVFGIGDSPGWLKGLGQLASGIKVGGDSVAPIAARPSAATAPSMNTLHGGSGAQPGPGVVYNIAVRDTEDAFIRAQQQERENAAAKLARF
jgi:hypothetical protein